MSCSFHKDNDPIASHRIASHHIVMHRSQQPKSGTTFLYFILFVLIRCRFKSFTPNESFCQPIRDVNQLIRKLYSILSFVPKRNGSFYHSNDKLYGKNGAKHWLTLFLMLDSEVKFLCRSFLLLLTSILVRLKMFSCTRMCSYQ